MAAPLVTYAFIHGDWRRLLGNGLFFSVFALALENDLGVVRFADLAILTPAIRAIVLAAAMM